MKTRHLFLPILIATVLRLNAGDSVDVSGREARIAAAALAKQNELLRADIVRLREEVVKLTLELARSRSEIDEGRARKGSGGQSADRRVDDGPRVVASADSEAWLIADVNLDLKLVVFGAGNDRDVKKGMPLACMRGEKVIARLRVVEVRERMTGAVIEEVVGSVNPEKGDRVVPMMAPK